MTATLEQFKSAAKPRFQQALVLGSKGPISRAWGREGSYVYDPPSAGEWVVPLLLYNALTGDKSVSAINPGCLCAYPSDAAAAADLEAARNKLYEQIGRLSDKRPFYGSASFTYMWDGGGYPEKFTRDPASQVPKEWYAHLAGSVYGAYCRNYPNEIEAYIDLGRAMVTAGDCAPATVSQPETEKVKTMEPKTTDTAVTTTAAKTYTPWPSPSGGGGVYWHKDNAAYGAASLPAELFGKLRNAVSASPDWAYYATAEDAEKDLARVRDAVALGKLEPVIILGYEAYGPRMPFSNYTEKYLKDHGTYAWSNDPNMNANHRLPPVVWAALTGKRGPFDGLRGDLVMYATALEAALDLRKALADLKWEQNSDGKWGPPKPKLAVNPPFVDREPASTPSKVSWYWVCPGYNYINPKQIANKDESRLPVEVAKRLPGVEPRHGGTYLSAYGTRDAAVKALNDLSAVLAAEEAAAKAEALKTGDDRAPARHSDGSWYWATPAYAWYARPAGADECLVTEDLLKHLPMTGNSGTCIRGYKTQEEAVKAYKDAKAEYEKQLAAAKFTPGKIPYPINQGPDSWYWATSEDELYWSGGTTEGLDTGMVTAEMFAVLKGEAHKTASNTWVAYKSKEEACAAYLAAEKKLEGTKSKTGTGCDREPAYEANAHWRYWATGGYPYLGSLVVNAEKSRVPLEVLQEMRAAGARFDQSCRVTGEWIATFDNQGTAVAAYNNAVKAIAARKASESKYVAQCWDLGYCFWKAGLKHGNFLSHPQSQLPSDVFNALEGARLGAAAQRAKKYPTAEAAAAALEAAEKKVAGKAVTTAATTEKNYLPYLLNGVWYWVSAKNPGMWGADSNSAHLPPDLFARLTRATKCVTEKGNCWAGYDSHQEAVAGLDDAKTLVAAKAEDKPAEPAYEPLPYQGSPGKFFWIAAGNTATGWPKGPALDKSILPDHLFALLRDKSTTGVPMSLNRYVGNHHNGYVTREAAMEDLASAQKIFADREEAAKVAAVARLMASPAPGRGTRWGRVEALRSSEIDEVFEVLNADPKANEVVVRCVTTQTLVVSTEAFAANFVSKDAWKLEADCDKDGRPVT